VSYWFGENRQTDIRAVIAQHQNNQHLPHQDPGKAQNDIERGTDPLCPETQIGGL
jgi:hypothetical protein